MNFKTIAAYAIGGLAAASLAALALPRHVSVERSAILDVAPDAVLALAASNAGYQAFNPYKTMDPQLQVDLFGPVSGVGSGFHFDSKDGTGHQTVSAVTADTVTYALDLGPLGQPTQSISAVPASGGAQVTWRVDADMGFNPVLRVMGLFMDGMMGPTFELGLEKLTQAAA
ncbi:MAG: SRPBCC family protein [Pseudomonadota bacterium]